MPQWKPITLLLGNDEEMAIKIVTHEVASMEMRQIAYASLHPGIWIANDPEVFVKSIEIKSISTCGDSLCKQVHRLSGIVSSSLFCTIAA